MVRFYSMNNDDSRKNVKVANELGAMASAAQEERGRAQRTGEIRRAGRATRRYHDRRGSEPEKEEEKEEVGEVDVFHELREEEKQLIEECSKLSSRREKFTVDVRSLAEGVVDGLVRDLTPLQVHHVIVALNERFELTDGCWTDRMGKS